MKIPASTILSFVTGRLYSLEAPTVLFADLLECATGQTRITTIELPQLKKEYAGKILDQTPPDFQEICNTWQHTEDWPERVVAVDLTFGSIEISFCA